MKKWNTIHRHTANPRASLTRSPGVSYTDVRVSLCGLLTRTVTATSAPINSARRMTAAILSPIGKVASGAATSDGPGCFGSALMNLIWCRYSSLVFVPALPLHRFAEFHPRVDPRAGRFLVHAFGQARDADRADDDTIERERHSAADKINLAGIHVHNAEVAVGPGLMQLSHRLRGLPVKRRGERLAFGETNVLQGGAIHAVRGHHVAGMVDHDHGHAHVALAGIGDSAFNDGTRLGEREQRRGVCGPRRRRRLRDRPAQRPQQQYGSYCEGSRQSAGKRTHHDLH